MKEYSEISVGLYGKPAWDMGIEEKVDVEEIKARGEILGKWLPRAAEIIDKLVKNGWDAQGTLYDIMLYKEISVKDAKEELKKLEIDPDNEVDLREDESYEEYEDEEVEEG